MEVNKPDQGVFKGMGKLQTQTFINRKYFPNIRNIHQFEYTHNHPTSYKTSFQSFRPFDKKDYKYERKKLNTNQSHFDLGVDKNLKVQSENRQHYKKYDFSLPPKLIRHSEEGIGINQYEQRTGEKITYNTTSNQNFGFTHKINQKQNIKYKYTRTDRFNPITGEFKSNTSFGFEDFVPQNNRTYKANNFSIIPKRGEKYDIISGRKLAHF